MADDSPAKFFYSFVRFDWLKLMSPRIRLVEFEMSLFRALCKSKVLVTILNKPTSNSMT